MIQSHGTKGDTIKVSEETNLRHMETQRDTKRHTLRNSDTTTSTTTKKKGKKLLVIFSGFFKS